MDVSRESRNVGVLFFPQFRVSLGGGRLVGRKLFTTFSVVHCERRSSPCRVVNLSDLGETRNRRPRRCGKHCMKGAHHVPCPGLYILCHKALSPCRHAAFGASWNPASQKPCSRLLALLSRLYLSRSAFLWKMRYQQIGSIATTVHPKKNLPRCCICIGYSENSAKSFSRA